jgi:hypothetical protein
MNNEELAILSDGTLNSLSDGLNKAIKELREKYGKDRLSHVSYTSLTAFHNMIKVELTRREKITQQKTKGKPLNER